MDYRFQVTEEISELLDGGARPPVITEDGEVGERHLDEFVVRTPTVVLHVRPSGGGGHHGLPVSAEAL